MIEPKRRALLSWSSGKDSAWALHRLRAAGEVEVVGLLTTFNEAFDRVAMHAVRRALVVRQASAVGLPLWPVWLPFPCSNEVYEARMKSALTEAVAAGISAIAFGDLHLTEIRDYRIGLLAGSGLDPLFPVWGPAHDAPAMARAIQEAGIRATLTCVDPRQLDPIFLGRSYDADFLAEIPVQVDPCGERGEFHTFCTDSPEFTEPIGIHPGEHVFRDGFWFADLHSA